MSVWTRPIKLNLREFLPAFGKLAIDVGTMQWSEAGKQAVDVAASLGLAAEPHELAGLLVNRAAMRAIVEILEPHRADFPAQIWEQPPDFEQALADANFTVDERFLDHPRTLPVVALACELVERWLGFVNLRGHMAKTIAARLPSRFVYMLHRECIEHRDAYARLFVALSGEFTPAWQRERSWDEYRAWFESELDASVFGESFGLRQIFVWPRAYTVEKAEDRRQRRHVVVLRDELDRWLTASGRDDVIRMISGDPGAGKSSFVRMFAAHRMGLGERVLVVPLHLLAVEDDLVRAIRSLCAESRVLPCEPFELGNEPLLLILDGLDELSKSGRAGEQLARELVHHVQKIVAAHNLDGRVRLRVLLSGRPIVVHDVAAVELREPGKVLHLVGYAEPRGGQTWAWVDPANHLAVDQRHVWWRRYGKLTNFPWDGVPEAFADEALFETTRQPLLGYLLALAHRDALQRGEDLAAGLSRNAIYQRLIHGVFERDYAKPASGHAALRDVERDEFDQLLEAMALAAWHEDGRIVRVELVERLCAKTGLSEVLARHRESSKRGVAQLFTAFYFRRHGGRDDETFEFTHKSFAEYLVARRFVHELKAAADLLADHDAAKGRRGRGKDEQGVLLDWLEVFGPSAITPDLRPYLDEEVRLAGQDRAATWQRASMRLIQYVLREGSPCEKLAGKSFADMLRWSSAAERALLELRHACWQVTREPSACEWPSPYACQAWLLRLNASGEGWRLGGLSMAGQVLSGGWLVDADLRGADLRDADLQNASLQNASLQNARLQNARLWGTDLQSAYLRGADLQDAQLWDADLRDADLRDANLRDANLRDANLQNADFRNADLQNADLRNADLQNAGLRNADLQNADLRNADLQDANFQDANLQGADLRGADLQNADLRNADLQNANLENAAIQSTTLTSEQRAQIRGTPRIVE